MKKFNLAIEKGRRYLANEEVISFYFIATEFIFNKEEIVSGNYHFEFKNDGHIFFQQKLNIDVDTRKVVVENSHEDPLIESDNSFFICGQLTKDLIKENFNTIECLFYFENRLIRQQYLSSTQIKSLFLLEKWDSYVKDNSIISNKDCVVRVHLGKNDATYYEENYTLEKHTIFDFSQYLFHHEYVAVQCSYEEDCDVEEKHVLKGIKGIWNSAYYYDQDIYTPMIPFSHQYTEIKNKDYLNINSIKELLNYYHCNELDTLKTFEMDDKFLAPYYKLHKTTSVGKVYSSQISKRFHIDSEICQNCNKRSECMQLVPSGLSELMFKRNLLVENFENCSIHKIIKSKE